MKQSYTKRLHESKEYRRHTLHLGPNRAERRQMAKSGLGGKEVWANQPYKKNADGSLGPTVG